MKISIKIVSLFLVSGLFSCEKKDSLDIDPNEPLFTIPEGFPEPKYKMESNPITADGFLLGKKLFFDGRLSRDGTISCAECHSQPYAFTHHSHAVSHGIDDRVGIRNAPGLMNLAWQDKFFWDGGVFDLDLFSIAPIQNPNEMDETVTNVIEKLKKDKEYPALFKKAFGTEEVTTQRFLKALSQYMLTLVTANSKYDQYKAGKTTFSNDEKEGLRLFTEKGCAGCHPAPLFTDHSFRSTGLDTGYFRDTLDTGRGRITEQKEDDFKFKVPTLRNIAYTFPYMHDGRFQTLEEALEHYNSGVVNLPNLDPAFKKNTKLGIQMTPTEKKQLVVFLNTLTDEDFLKNKRFSY
ncbi:MAG: cytochrome-c peroxidase [Cytophagaceae bacterium]|nr:cytochrome-c peroxidase [Cytophagaceae bacterium]MBK9511604.1 cytochrome-c peroxidase [Cytophagaceae bacterium]MBK9935007.1 cytochrome-c peroxidase [Cytophagaceae bacterium]MBL0301448.1 cytochrome-c peroxidase [Cytophagaceae bacterium]MBL0324269.1 cytochrome-c peroxidase [Cytophagaceae bacterium]